MGKKRKNKRQEKRELLKEYYEKKNREFSDEAWRNSIDDDEEF